MYNVNEKEFLSVINLNIDKRIKYFKNMVCDQCVLWLSYDGCGNLIGNYDTDGNECIYVWPNEIYGLHFLNKTKFKDKIAATNLKAINIYDFLREYIDELMGNGIFIMMFPTDNGGALITAKDFKIMMDEELSRYDDLDEKYNDDDD